MVKKLQKMAEKKAASPTGLMDSQLAQTIKDSAQQIWLAGLGAFAKAQGEGTKVYDTLVKEGSNLHRKTQTVAESRLGDVAGRMSAMAGEVGSKANAQWDKLESIFEERTARALQRLGVPTAKELTALNDRLDALTAAVAALGGSTAAPAKAARKTRSAPKAAAAPAVALAPAAPVARKARPTQRAAAPAVEKAKPKRARKTAGA